MARNRARRFEQRGTLGDHKTERTARAGAFWWRAGSESGRGLAQRRSTLKRGSFGSKDVPKHVNTAHCDMAVRL